MAEINLKLKGLAEIRSELKQLQFDLSQATDPQQMAELSERAGVLRDNLKRANEQVAVFAAGSPFEQTNNALGLMGSQLMSLDFEGSAESAKLFAQAAKGINGDLIAGQLKSLGSTVTTLGSTFVKLGATLLANPIFLMAAAVAGIIAVLGALMSKLGLLQPILDAVGDLFAWIGGVIDGVVQSMKDFLDWLGLTTFAAEEAAAKQGKAFAEIQAKSEEMTKAKETQYDREIRLAKIAGEDTTRLEKEKQTAIIKTQQVRYKAIHAQIEANKISGQLTDEEIKKLKEQAKEAKGIIESARFEKQAIDAQEVADSKKKNTDIAKANADAYKAAQEARRAALSEIKKLEQDYADSLLSDQERELVNVERKYAKALEMATKYGQDSTALLEAQLNEKNAVNLKYAQAELEIEEQKAAEKKAMEDEAKAIEDAARLEALEVLKQANAEAALIDLSERERQELAVNEKYGKLIALAEQYGQDTAALARAQAAELEAIDEAARQKKLAGIEATNSMAADLTKGSLQGISDLVGAFAGKSLSAQKKAFETQKKLNIAIATIDMIKGGVSAFTGMVSSIPGPVGIALGVVAAAGVVASGIANIKKITSTKFEGGGGGTASAPSVSLGGGGSSASVAPATPSLSLFGENNNANNLSASPSAEANKQPLVVKAVVSETEMTAVQNKNQQFQTNAEL
jgi:hypothetical protein